MARIAPSVAGTAPAPAPKASKSKEPQHGEFLVLLDDQAQRETQKAFDMPMGLDRRKFVASTLIDKMMKTQQPLWDVLDGLKNTGHVSEFQPLWIQNAIVVKGDAEAQAVMSSAAGVAQAQQSARYVLDDPQRHGEVLAGDEVAPEADDPQWNLTKMNVKAADKQKLDGSGVTVGIIDTGVDFTHPALRDKYRGYDPATGSQSHTANWHDSTPEKSPEPVDVGRHGTHVAGTIGGQLNKDRTGLATGATMIAARGLGEEGGTDGMLLNAFQAMVAPRIPTPGTSPGSKREMGLGADVINNSWGSVDGMSVSYANALRNMAAMGVVNVISAGNDGQGGKAGSIGSPASSPWIVSVGALGKDLNAAEFSSRGPNPLPSPDGEPVPFVAGPGVDIRSTVPGDGFERGWQGTSMSAPAVTGFIALAQQAALEETGSMFDVRGVREVLKRASVDVDAKGVDDNTGYGMPVATKLRSIVKDVAKDFGLSPEPSVPDDKPAVAKKTARAQK